MKENIYKASMEVINNGGSAGIVRVSIEDFNKNYKVSMRELYRQLKEDRYSPKPALRVFILKDDGRKRPLGIPMVRDRIAQATVRRIPEPIFEKVFCDCSFGVRHGRSQIDAINNICTQCCVYLNILRGTMIEHRDSLAVCKYKSYLYIKPCNSKVYFKS